MPEATCYILQREVKPGDKPLHHTKKTPDLPPDTVLIIDEAPDDPAYKFRDHSPDDILDKSGSYDLVKVEKGEPPPEYYWGILDNGRVVPTELRHSGVDRPKKDPPTGLVVPPKIVRASGIASGDKVTVSIDDDKRLVTIVSVNGEHDLSKVKALLEKGKLGVDYPKDLIPLGLFGHTLRVSEIMSPAGFGSNVWILGPGGSGKTVALLQALYALLRLAQIMESLRIIVVYVGERAKDVGLYKKVRDMVPFGERAEFYFVDEDIPSTNQYATMRFAIERAKQLARKHDVVVFIDSLSRAVFAHSYGGYVDTDKSGMIGGGIYTVSLEEVAREVGGAGYFEETGTSLTFFSSLLYSDERQASAVVQFTRETRENKPDVLWEFINNPSLRDSELKNKGYPWISVHERHSYHREPPEWIEGVKPYIPDELRVEMNRMRDDIWKEPVEDDKGNQRDPQSEDRHNRLVRYAEQDKLPAYANLPEYAALLE